MATLAQQLTPILIFNKMDRLILELKMRPAEAHVHLVKLLELVNAVAASFRSTTSTCHTNSTFNSSNHPDDEPLFSPVASIVLFASAVDCWAFGYGVRNDHFELVTWLSLEFLNSNVVNLRLDCKSLLAWTPPNWVFQRKTFFHIYGAISTSLRNPRLSALRLR